MRLWPVNQAFSVAVGPDPSSHVAPVHALLHAPIRVTSATMSYNVSADASITSEWEMVSVPTVTYGRIAFVVDCRLRTTAKQNDEAVKPAVPTPNHPFHHCDRLVR